MKYSMCILKRPFAVSGLIGCLIGGLVACSGKSNLGSNADLGSVDDGFELTSLELNQLTALDGVSREAVVEALAVIQSQNSQSSNRVTFENALDRQLLLECRETCHITLRK